MAEDGPAATSPGSSTVGAPAGAANATADYAGRVALRLAEAADGEIDAIVLDALAHVAALANADRSYVTLYHDDGTFENSHEWTAHGVVPQRPVIQEMNTREFPYTSEMARRGEVFAAPDITALPDAAEAERRSFSSFGVRAVLQAPIVLNGRGVALVGLNYFRAGVEWSDELVDDVCRVGQALAVAVLRHRAAHTLRHADEQIARARRVQDDLLAHFSHELRTPLYAMLGYAELLEHDERSERRRNSLMEIQFHSRHLLSMVDDLISFAAEPGGRQVELVEVGPIVGATLDALEPVAELRRVRCAIDPDVWSTAVHTEVGRLRQVVHCILSGAVQSLPAGSAIVVGIEKGGDASSASDTPAISVELSSTEAIGIEDVEMPLATAIIDGHGSIDYRTTDRDDRLDVLISFKGRG